MFVRVNANSQKPRPLGELHTLSDEKAFMNEFKYPKNTEVFGEGEPAEYVFQIVEGAVRSYNRTVAARSAHSTYQATSSASKQLMHIDLRPKLSLTLPCELQEGEPFSRVTRAAMNQRSKTS
jgi:CRP-like cAMP-binding protein